MSICNECWGKGWIEKQGVQFDCRKCKGTGVIENEPQTNEEWLHTLNTEQLAEALTKVVLDLVSWNNDPKPSEVRNILKSWLKQPHTVKE